MKSNIFILILLICSLNYGQSITGKFNHLANDFQLNITENDQGDFEVFITNITNSNDTDKKIISKKTTQAEFEKIIFNSVKKLTAKYNFKNESIDALVLTPNEVNNFNYDSIINKLTPNKFWILKKFKEKIGYTTYKEFKKNKLKDTSTSFLDSILFITKTKSNNKTEYHFKYENTKKQFTNDAEFNTGFYDLVTTKRTILEKFYPKDIKDNILDIGLSNENSHLIAKLFNETIANDTYTLLGNYSAKNKSTTLQTVYAASIKHQLDKNQFILRLCNSETCKNTISLDLKIEPSEFKTLVLEITNSLVEGDAFNNQDIDNLYIKCIKANEKVIIDKAITPIKKELTSVLEAVDNEKTAYSGILKLNKKIPTDNKDLFFMPHKASIRIFNNKAQNIVVVGDVVDKKGKLITEKVLVNFSYSVPFRGLIDGDFSIKFSVKGKDVVIKYKELFNYYPDGKTFNFAAKNGEYEITNQKNRDTVKIKQRKFLDYFTPIIFSDVLGLNSNNSNSLIIAEAKLRVPLNNYNYKCFSLVSSIHSNANISLYNGFSDNTRVITEESAIAPFSRANISTFDIVKFANINTNISLDILSFELKRLSTHLNIGTGIRYYRAGYKYTFINANGKDEIYTDQFNALAPELHLNFQIRPQENIGADLNIAYSWLKPRGSKKSTTMVDYQFNDSLSDKAVLQLNLDLYVKLFKETSKGGANVRIGGWYHQKSKDFYPQLLVGYATNLTNFVNKFKGEQ